MSADSNKKILPDKKIYFVYMKCLLSIIECIENNKSVAREMFNFRDLRIINTVLNRKRMNSQSTDKRIELLLCGLIIIKPDKAPFFQAEVKASPNDSTP